MRSERSQNRLIRKFAAADPEAFQRFLESADHVALEQGANLGAVRAHAEYVYFLESGIVVLVAALKGGESVAIATVGREGVAGLPDALGSQLLPYRMVVQQAGLAVRVPTAVIRDAIMSCTALHDLLMEYSQSVVHELAQAVLCGRFHSSSQRFARWLLDTLARGGNTRLTLTHEFVSQMLGVPRSAITQSAASLRRRGAIDYRRGVLTIKREDRLRKAACECAELIGRAEGRGQRAEEETG